MGRGAGLMVGRSVHQQWLLRMGAEGVGFEPTVPCDTAVFETARFGHSRTPPQKIRV